MAESSGPSPKANNSNKSRAKEKPARSHPTLHKMVLEALDKSHTPKGMTMRGIKKYITDNYLDKENFPNWRLRTAVKKGLENNEIRRPKSSVEEGLAGHFLLNRVLIAQKEKEQKKKQKPLKPTKDRKKVAKSPKAKKTAVVKNSAKSPKKSAKPISKSPGKSTPKAKTTDVKRDKSTVRTPKTSKADSAGAQAKTASVKKLKKTLNKAEKKNKK